MSELGPMFVAALTGLISGLLLSIPVGPVNLTIINEGARRGFRFAALVGLGAVTMEIIYCSIAFTSFSSIFNHGWVKMAINIFSAVFMLFLGLKFLIIKKIPAENPVAGHLQAQHPPKSAFMTGFVRVLGNPGVLGVWIVLSYSFINHDWVDPTRLCKIACVTGVGLGTGLWFMGLSYAVARGHHKFSEKTLLRVERGSGIGLILLGVGQGLHLVYKLARAHGKI